jgi:adenylate kinase family enzyme
MLLGPFDALPPARRILLRGASGSGKTTLGRTLAQRTGIRYIELDSLFHGPDWVPRESFAKDVAALAAEPEWITEYGYSRARPILAPRGELLVWLDLPRWRVMSQVVTRTVRRRVAREQLWNGNVEPPFRSFLTDPDHIVRWAWRTQPEQAAEVQRLRAARPDLPVVRLRSRREVHAWLAGPASGLLDR